MIQTIPLLVEAVVTRVAARHLQVSQDELTLETRLNGGESEDALIIAGLRDEFQIQISSEEEKSIFTVLDAIWLVKNKVLRE